MARGFSANQSRGFGAREYGGSYEGHPSRDTYIGIDEAGNEIRGDDEGNKWVAGGGRIQGRIFSDERERDVYEARQQSPAQIEKFTSFAAGKSEHPEFKNETPENVAKLNVAKEKYIELRKIATKAFNEAEEAAKEKWKQNNPGKTDYAGRARIDMVKAGLNSAKQALMKELGMGEGAAEQGDAITPIHTSSRDSAWEEFKDAIIDNPNKAAARILLEKLVNDKTVFLRAKGHIRRGSLILDEDGSIEEEG